MTPPEWLYYLGCSIKRAYALRYQKRLPNKVISIGNITVGGTGKTPAAIAVAQEAMKRGCFPVILTRGYKGSAKGPCFVSRGEGPLLSSAEAGDEPVLMAKKLQDVHIVKSADRYEGGLFALAQLGQRDSLVFVLDDGFQHWRLYRDIDVVLVDGLDPFGNRRLLPLGRLREPLGSMQRADVFVVTKIRNDELAAELKSINPAAPVYYSRYDVSRLRDSNGKPLSVDTISAKRVYAFCGIAHPESFKLTIAGLPVELCGFRSFSDHHRYMPRDLVSLESNMRSLSCDFLLTTEKDMVKLKGLAGKERIFSLGIEMEIEGKFYDKLFGADPGIL
jgi:tetraacyldisaccharide 4'-kinase